MIVKEILDNLAQEGVTLTLTNNSIKILGCLTSEQRELVKNNKELIIAELRGDESPELTTEQQITNLIALGNDRELAALIIWAWENDHTWPIKPFYLSVADSTIPRYIADYKAFYHDIGLSLNGQGTMDKFELKHVLIALKELTTNVNMEFAS